MEGQVMNKEGMKEAGGEELVDRRGFFRRIVHRGMEELEQMGREAGRKIGDWVSEVREKEGEEAGKGEADVRPADGAVERYRGSR